MKKTKKEQELSNFQMNRLLLVMNMYVTVWFLLKLETLITVNTTIIHTVIDCSDLEQLEQIISVLEVVRKDTYNLLGSISFWGVSWMKAASIMSEKGFTASRYYLSSISVGFDENIILTILRCYPAGKLRLRASA